MAIHIAGLIRAVSVMIACKKSCITLISFRFDNDSFTLTTHGVQLF
jgi:hypothetical protein